MTTLTAIKPSDISNPGIVWKNTILTFWYNDKPRTIRVEKVGPTYVLGEEGAADKGNFSTHFDSGIYKNFSFGKMTNVHRSCQATTREGVALGADD